MSNFTQPKRDKQAGDGQAADKQAGDGQAEERVPSSEQVRKGGGCFDILPADRVGNKQKIEPYDLRARRIYFKLKDGVIPTADQVELYARFERLLHALNDVYPEQAPRPLKEKWHPVRRLTREQKSNVERANESDQIQRQYREDKFRYFYLQVFGLAQVTLGTGEIRAEAAKTLITHIEQELVADEGPKVKERNIHNLLRAAALLSFPFVALYVVLSRAKDGGPVDAWLQQIQIATPILANFMLLWLGCFLGVCLSYALRKPEFTVDDLSSLAHGSTDVDLLTPSNRLLFVGALAMVLVMLAMVKVVDITIGSLSISSIISTHFAMQAFVLGVVLGIAEKLLPEVVQKKTSTMFATKP